MDWIEEFLSQTEGVRSPLSFRLWTAISTIASVVERRIWTQTDVDRLYPNLYTVLTGGPASGKTIMVTTAKRLLNPLAVPNGIYLAPDNPNKPTFLDSIESATKPAVNGQGSLFVSPMTVLCMELGVLISKYEKDFVADLTLLYDNPDTYTAPRRQAKSIALEAPTVNILACATPDAIGDIMPDTAWGQGFTSRIVFIYGTIPNIHRNIFKKRRDIELDGLGNKLEEIFHEVHGEVEWEPEAQDAMDYWFNVEKMAPIPTYAKLVNYCGRRDTHVMKLAMVSATSQGHGLLVTLDDFLRAKEWLLEAEKTMPDVFRAMGQKSDMQLMQDVHYLAWSKYGSVDIDKRRPLTDQDMWKFFQDKCPSEKIDGLIKTMEKVGILRRGLQPGTWIPNPLSRD